MLRIFNSFKRQQWFLNGGGRNGADMNVKPAWARGYTGKGVVVSILDDGEKDENCNSLCSPVF